MYQSQSSKTVIFCFQSWHFTKCSLFVPPENDFSRLPTTNGQQLVKQRKSNNCTKRRFLAIYYKCRCKNVGLCTIVCPETSTQAQRAYWKGATAPPVTSITPYNRPRYSLGNLHRQTKTSSTVKTTATLKISVPNLRLLCCCFLHISGTFFLIPLVFMNTLFVP